MAEYKDFSEAKIFAVLGYDGRIPARIPKQFRVATSMFLKKYEAFSGRKVPHSKSVDTTEARLCAASFLEQKDHASRYFPPDDGAPVWPHDLNMYAFPYICPSLD